ncbi:cation:proton antiporter [Kitasatospora sp. NBC_01560]|uniref:cation:proton antiporter n=1 Tax=Kitasatospora sp. NBC_01560 TaxID=2975965 RepID=UPI003867C07E
MTGLSALPLGPPPQHAGPASLALPVSALPTHQLLLLLTQICVLLALALLCGRAAARIGMPPVVGELSVGVLFGPSVLGHIAPELSDRLLPAIPEQFHLLDAVGQIGVILLVGITGMEVDLALVRRRGRSTLNVALLGLVVPFALGVATGYLLPDSLIPAATGRTVFAIFLGVALCVSAMPVIAKTLTDMNLLHRNIGQLIITAAIVDDVIGWLLLSVVSAMAVGPLDYGNAVLGLGRAILVVLVAGTVGRRLVGRLMRKAASSREPAVPIATGAALLLGSAAVTQALNLEAMFGAFLAGALIGTTGQEVVRRLAPLRTVVLAVFAPLFFASAGLRIDLASLRHPSVALAGAAVLLVAVIGKFGGAFLGALVGRLNRWEALALGAGMNARGVIQIVIATAGLRLGVLTTDMYTVIILIAITTSAMAPPVLNQAVRRIEQTAEEGLRQRDRSVAENDRAGVPSTPAH